MVATINLEMSKQVCIWCKKSSPEVSFQNEAHTIPVSLGGTEICPNVCDNCNHFFGSPQKNLPAIETIIKEAFNVTRMRLLAPEKIGKNKPLSRFTSIYFDVNLRKKKLSIKPAFRFKPGFQSILCRQFKRGLFKIFLEEIERQKQKGLDEEFTFIREYSRYNLNEYPVLYFPRKHGAMLLLPDEVDHPVLHLDPVMKYHIVNYNFFEFELFGHLFSIPTSRNYLIMQDKYLQESIKSKGGLFNPPIEIKYLTDVDLLLSVMNSK
jgi:hypothetical protein